MAENVVRRVVVEKAAVRRYLRRIASQEEGILVDLSARQVLAILDCHSVTWMAYRAGSLRLVEEGEAGTRLTASSPDILDVARETIEGAKRWTT